MVAVDAVTDTSSDREAAFRAEVAAMKVRGGTVARERVFARIGAALLVAGVVVGVVALLVVVRKVVS